MRAACPGRRIPPGAGARPPDRQGQAAGDEYGDSGRRIVPDAEQGVEARFVVGDEVEHRIVTGAGKRRPERVGDSGRRSEADQDERRRPQHRSDDFPVGIDDRKRRIYSRSVRLRESPINPYI